MRWHTLLFCFLMGTIAAEGQGTPAADIVAHLRVNAQKLTTSIPAISCDEHIDSQRVSKGEVKDEMKIESSFRMIRAQSRSTSLGGLTEFRTHRVVNGKPVTTQKDKPPFSFTGGYVNMLDILTARKCASYSIESTEDAGSDATLTLLSVEDRSGPGCASTQANLLKALVDRKSLELLRVESTMHDVHFGGLIAHLPFVAMPSSHNLWKVSVSYAPVTLGDRTFWLPKRIASTVADSRKPLSLRYVADYSACHLYTATATVLNAAGAN